jgi:hypothetical protein
VTGGGCGGPGGAPFVPFARLMEDMSIDCARGKFSVLIATAGCDVAGSALLELPQCWASNERLSSIGVNIL